MLIANALFLHLFSHLIVTADSYPFDLGACSLHGHWQPVTPGYSGILEVGPGLPSINLRFPLRPRHWVLLRATLDAGDCLRGATPILDVGLDTCPPPHPSALATTGCDVYQVLGGDAREAFVTYSLAGPAGRPAVPTPWLFPAPGPGQDVRRRRDGFKSFLDPEDRTSPCRVNISLTEVAEHSVTVPLGSAHYLPPDLRVGADPVVMYRFTVLSPNTNGSRASLGLSFSGDQEWFAGHNTVLLSRPFLRGGPVPICGGDVVYAAVWNRNLDRHQTMLVLNESSVAPFQVNASDPYESIRFELPAGVGSAVILLTDLRCRGCSVHIVDEGSGEPTEGLGFQALSSPPDICPFPSDFWMMAPTDGLPSSFAGFITLEAPIIALTLYWVDTAERDSAILIFFRQPIHVPPHRPFDVPLPLNPNEMDAVALAIPLPPPYLKRGATLIFHGVGGGEYGVWIRCGGLGLSFTDTLRVEYPSISNGSEIYTVCQAGDEALYAGLHFSPKAASLERHTGRPFPPAHSVSRLHLSLELRLDRRACRSSRASDCNIAYPMAPFASARPLDIFTNVTRPSAVVCQAYSLPCDSDGVPMPLCHSACQAAARCLNTHEADLVAKSPGCKTAYTTHCGHVDACPSTVTPKERLQEATSAIYGALFCGTTALVGAMIGFFVFEDWLISRQLTRAFLSVPLHGSVDQ